MINVNILKKVIANFAALVILSALLSLIHVELSEVTLAKALASISNPATLLLAIFFAGILPFAHELAHKSAYKLVNKNAVVEISKTKKTWFVNDQSDIWYTRLKMLFVLFAPLVVSFFAYMLYAISPNPYAQVCLAVFVLSIISMLKDLLDAISIISDQERFEYKYGPEGKLMRRCVWEKEYCFYG